MLPTRRVLITKIENLNIIGRDPVSDNVQCTTLHLLMKKYEAAQKRPEVVAFRYRNLVKYYQTS